MKKSIILLTLMVVGVMQTLANGADVSVSDNMGVRTAYEEVNLTADMYHEWDGYEADANIIGSNCGVCEFGVSTGLPYGNGNVWSEMYADLTDYKALFLVVTEGAPRLLFNWGYSNIEITSEDSPYVILVKDGVWQIDLDKITTEYGYAHLNAIKGAYWANTTITEAILVKGDVLTDDDFLNSCPTIIHTPQALAEKIRIKYYYLPNLTVYYSINGGEAVEYTGEFLVDESCDIVAWAVNGNGVKSQVSETVFVNLDYIVVDVKAPGTLEQLVYEQVDDAEDVRMLRITGSLNDDDAYFIRSALRNIVAIDLYGTDMTYMMDEMLGDRPYLCSVKLPANLRTIGSYALDYCPQLTEIELPESLERINYHAFYQCTNLAKVKWNNNLKNIGGYAFYGTALTEFIAPESLTGIDYEAFYNCRQLQTVKLNEGLTYIGSWAFESCTALTTIELPSTLATTNGWIFGGDSNLKTIVCRAASIPSTDSELFDSYYAKQMTLYVPYIAVNNYKINRYWGRIGTVLPIEGTENDDIVVRGNMYVDVETKVTGKPSVSVEVYNDNNAGHGNMWVETKTFDASKFTMMMDDYYCFWDKANDWGGYNVINSYATLINNGNMTADSVFVANKVRTNSWSFMCLPFNVNAGDIKFSQSADADYALRRYNGHNRATGEGATWQSIYDGDIIAAGEGFIVHHNGYTNGSDYGEFEFPAIDDDKKNAIFTHSDVKVALAEYTSSNTSDRSWNLIGNPYPAFYDLRYSDFTAPVTIWKGNKYEAINPVDDNYILHPFEAMFVQRPAGKASILFSADGRQTTNEVREMDYAPRRNSNARGNRQLVDITIGDGERSDRTRLVVNEEASTGYELDRDAAKFFANGGDALDIYTIEGDVKMAINERPAANGVVKLGMRIGTAGQYTIAMNSRTAADIVLVDLAQGTETSLADGNSYTFECAAGTIADRFEVRLAGDATGMAATEAADGTEEYYTTGGIVLTEKPAARGIYMMKKNGAVRKVVIK